MPIPAGQTTYMTNNIEIRGFYELLLTPPIFYPNFGSVSVAPDRPCWGQWEQGL